MPYQQATATGVTTAIKVPLSQRPHPTLKCSHCGGRLFLSSDYQYKRLRYFWECIVCSREFNLDSTPVTHAVVESVKREGWTKYPVRGAAVAVR